MNLFIYIFYMIIHIFNISRLTQKMYSFVLNCHQIFYMFYQSNYVYFISGFGDGQGQQIHPGMFLYYLSLYHNIYKHLRQEKVQYMIFKRGRVSKMVHPS